jgi:hypothetical protein
VHLFLVHRLLFYEVFSFFLSGPRKRRVRFTLEEDLYLFPLGGYVFSKLFSGREIE